MRVNKAVDCRYGSGIKKNLNSKGWTALLDRNAVYACVAAKRHSGAEWRFDPNTSRRKVSDLALGQPATLALLPQKAASVVDTPEGACFDIL
jgi:hypothetical protein